MRVRLDWTSGEAAASPDTPLRKTLRPSFPFSLVGKRAYPGWVGGPADIGGNRGPPFPFA